MVSFVDPFVRYYGGKFGDDERKARRALLIMNTVGNFLMGGFALVILCLLAVRLDSDSAGGDPAFSLGVVFIPVFVILGILFCCFCCCMPCLVLGGGLQPQGEGAGQPEPLIQLSSTNH